MPSVVVDTNIWVSAIIKSTGRYAKLIREIAQHGTLFTAEEIIAEAHEVVLRTRIQKRYRLSEAIIDQTLQEIRSFTTVVTDLPDLDVVKTDPDDNLIVACAAKASAEYIVSYDPHLINLKEYQGIRILTPQQFRPLLNK